MQIQSFESHFFYGMQRCSWRIDQNFFRLVKCNVGTQEKLIGFLKVTIVAKSKNTKGVKCILT